MTNQRHHHTGDEMLYPLDTAPCNVPLILAGFDDMVLIGRLNRMGMFVGDEVMRMDEDISIRAVRIEGPGGEVVLAPGMGAKVIAHHDDGHKTPIMEMNPGEQGHVEGLVCGDSLEWGLSVLGIRENDRVEMKHAIPPMEYHVVADGRRVRLPEGAAAKVWGAQDGRPMQLCMAGTGKPFAVEELLGGKRAVGLLERNNIVPGRTVVVEQVVAARVMWQSSRSQVVVQASSGLRLYLRPDQARGMFVRVKGGE